MASTRPLERDMPIVYGLRPPEWAMSCSGPCGTCARLTVESVSYPAGRVRHVTAYRCSHHVGDAPHRVEACRHYQREPGSDDVSRL